MAVLKVKTFHYTWLFSVFVLNTLLSNAQSLQVNIVSNDHNNSFCEGVPEDFILTANPSGGKEPYYYEWTFSWSNDTAREKTIIARPEEIGIVKLKVTDSSYPAKSKDATFFIKEVFITADFTFADDSVCAQTAIHFLPTVTGGTPDYYYWWDFGDDETSDERNPVHEYISSACSGMSEFVARLNVYDKDGCSAYAQKNIHVKNKPYLDFRDEGSIFNEPFKHCHPVGADPRFMVDLHNHSQNTSCITSYHIDWDDGNVETGATFPISHWYEEVGAYELTITATNSSGCDLIWTTFVYNQSSPAAGLESYGGTEGCAPIEYSFGLVGYENNSVGTTYTWDFGDSSPQIIWDDEEPFDNDTISHLYRNTSCLWSETGDYTTVVTVNNGCGEIKATVTGVRVWTTPGAAIKDGGIDTICTNEPIRFSNGSSSGYYGSFCNSAAQYFWDFGNGDTADTRVMPLYSWSEPGLYFVRLEASNPCGTTTDDYPIMVFAPPVADAHLWDTDGCVPFVPEIENLSTGRGLEYLWQISPDTGFSFLNGTDEESFEPEISFNKSGTYKMVLHVLNACDQTDSVVYTLDAYTRPSGKLEDLSNVCITNPVIHPSVTYNDHGTPISVFSWVFNGGVPASVSSEVPGEITYSAAGRYIIDLHLENECGSRYLTDTFYVHEAPEIELIPYLSICESNSLSISGTSVSHETSFVWQTLGDGLFNNDALENPIYYPGTGDLMNLGAELRIIAEGESPCATDTAILSFSIQELPRVQVDEDAIVCEGEAYEINDAIAFNYDIIYWSTGGDGSFSDPNSLLPLYYPGQSDLSLGQVEVSLTAQAIHPCLLNASESFTITYARNPTISAGPDQDICEDGQIALNANGTGFETVLWNLEVGEGTFNDPSSLTPVFTLNPGYSGSLLKLSIEATGAYGCEAVYDTIELSIVPHPLVFAGTDATACESDAYDLRSASIEEYSDFYWTLNGDGTLSDNSLLNPVYIPGASDIANGMVTLTLTAEGNSVCADISDEIIINIQALPQAFAGNDQDVCKVNNYITEGQLRNGATVQWTSLGTGNFENDSELITGYYPSDIDKDFGSVDLVLKVNAMAPCSSPDYDTVTLTFVDPPEVFAGNDTSICSDSFVPNSAQVLNSTQYVWSSTGGGTLIDPTTLAPTYLTTESDISSGSVFLILSSANPACPSVSDTMELDLTPYPIAEAGTDDLICENDTKTLNDSYAENYTSLEWATDGDGSFDQSSILHPVYAPGVLDINNGSVKLYLTVSGIAPCNTPETDSITLSIQKNPVVYAGPDAIISEGESFTNSAQVWNVGQISWSTLGDGTFTNGFSPRSTYIHGENDLLNKGVELVITGNSISPCVNESRDTIFLQITPKPVADAGDDENICEGSDITISTASAEEYSEIFWTTLGTGLLENGRTLNPTYHPSNEDIENRIVVLSLHARGKDPIEDMITSDSMHINIIHNANIDVLQSDTACENSTYQVNDVIYQDVNMISWSSSGSSNFNGTGQANPIYNFSSNDRGEDSLYFYVQVNSILPCLNVDHDTLMIRLYHEPEPLFDYINPEGCAPLTVGFTNNSSGEDLTYSWDLGNGLESMFEEPGEITYQQGRIADTTYTVTLEATNRCNSVSTSKDVIVKPIPITDFGMDVLWGCSPKEINLFNVTTGLADTYLWNWGDGMEGSFEEHPGSHIFVTGDYDTTYTISLIAENECGVDSLEKTVRIFPSTVDAFFETDTSFGCAPLEVSFTNYSRGVLGDEPFLSWSWNFGDDNSISETMNPVHIFETPGIYTVTLYVNDTCSQDYFTTEVHVMGAPLTEFVTDKTEYCSNDTVFVTPVNMPIDGIASVIWDFGDSTQAYDFNSEHVYNGSGVYTINMTAKHIINGCIASTSRDISIYQGPVAAFGIPDNDGCQSLDITFMNETDGGEFYAWDFGNGNISIDKNGQQLFTEAGSYTVTLKTLDDEGCRDSVSHKLLVNPKPSAEFESSSLQSCFAPVDVEFMNLSQGGDDFVWDFGDGSSSKLTSPVINYRDYGDYPVSLIATNMFNCSDTSEMVYHAYHNPVADFNVDTAIGCDPFVVQFDNLSEYGLEYHWDFEDQGQSSQENPTFTFSGEGKSTISLVVVGSGGCSDSISKEQYITTNPSPVSDFSYSRINEIDTVQFHNYSSGAISYLWDFDDGQSSEETDPWHKYNYYGIYMVSLTATNEYDCRNTSYESINFELFKGLFLPNAFSPGNLSEDVREFKAVGIGLIKYHLLVYDAWGNQLWETEKLERGAPAEGWDGTLNGKPLIPDVYVWHLKEAIFKDGTAYEGPRYGTITLIK